MKRLLPLLILIFILGCSGLKREYPQRDYYVLNVVQDIKSENGSGVNYIKIQRTDINPSYLRKEFNYKISEDEFISDFYNQFYKPAPALITAEVYKWLTNSGIFKDVLPTNSLVDAKYLLDSNIVDIYGDFTDPVNPKAVLNMQFFLVDDSGVKSILFFSQVYNQTVSINDRSPSALVNGWNEALKNILKDFESDLRSLDNL